MVASQIWSIFVCSTGIHHLTHFNGIKKVLVYKTKKNNFLKCKCACFQNLFLIYQFLIYPMIGKFVTVWYFNTYINHLTLSVQSLTNMSSMWNPLTLHLLTFWHLTFWHEKWFWGKWAGQLPWLRYLKRCLQALRFSLPAFFRLIHYFTTSSHFFFICTDREPDRGYTHPWPFQNRSQAHSIPHQMVRHISFV